MLKIEKDQAIDRADICDQQAKDANKREEMLRDEVGELKKKLWQMQQDLNVSRGNLNKSNMTLEEKERSFLMVCNCD